MQVLIDADADELVSYMTPKIQTNYFPAIYTVVEDSLIGVIRQRYKGI